jgi:hypothetical protein
MTLMTLLAMTSTAEAGRGGAPDLEVSLSAPTSVDVDTDSTFTVDVANTGSGNADDVELVILLPETATSPTVHVLGELGGVDGRCVQVDTTLECSLGRIRKGRSTSVSFDFAAPWAAVDLDIDVYATSSGETDLSDNDDGVTLDVIYVDQAISGPAGVSNRHCTGSGLTAFFECELYPSSISGHDILLEADGSITFGPGVSGYTGSWWQDTDDHLHFEYSSGGSTRLIFDGNGVGGDTFEGIASFPGTGYNAGYEVYFREL